MPISISSNMGSMNSNLSLNSSLSRPGMNGNLSLDIFSNMGMGSMNMNTTMNAFASMNNMSFSNATGASGVNFNIWGNGSVNPSGRINTDAPTYVIVHGWRNTGGNASNGYKPGAWLADQAQTIRQRESNANIVVVDWEKDAANPLYFPSASKTQEVGNQL